MRRKKRLKRKLFDPRRILIHDIKGENKGIELTIWWIWILRSNCTNTVFFFSQQANHKINSVHMPTQKNNYGHYPIHYTHGEVQQRLGEEEELWTRLAFLAGNSYVSYGCTAPDRSVSAMGQYLPERMHDWDQRCLSLTTIGLIPYHTLPVPSSLVYVSLRTVEDVLA